MKYTFFFFFLASQFHCNAADDITKSFIANKDVTHAIEKRNYLHLVDCPIDSIGLFFLNKIKQHKINAYSYSDKSDDFKVDSKWIRDFFDEKIDTVVADTNILYEKNKILSINNPDNLFIKQTIFFDEKQNTLKANVNYLAIPAIMESQKKYDENIELPVCYFSINHNEKYKKPTGKKIGVFSTDIFRSNDSSISTKNYYDQNLIDLLFTKAMSKEFKIFDINPNRSFLNSEYGFGVDSLFIKDPTSGLIEKAKAINDPPNKYRDWLKIRLVEEQYLTKKNVASAKILAVIFYFSLISEVPKKYYPMFYIKINEPKNKVLEKSKYY